VFFFLGAPWVMALRQPSAPYAIYLENLMPHPQTPNTFPPSSELRGAGKSKSTGPPVHLLNPRPTHPPSDFFFLDLSF
jgi:hypothetical protein